MEIKKVPVRKLQPAPAPDYLLALGSAQCLFSNGLCTPPDAFMNGGKSTVEIKNVKQ
jgi:hypothetical protein